MFRKVWILTAATGFLFPMNVLATDIKNEDSTSYNLRIEMGNTTFTNQIGAISTQTDICDKKCKISLRGASIEAEKDDVIIIKNGQFTKKPKEQKQQ
ncbi:MAG TPA: hypothetical protein V6D13_01595 [Halomicronema sp.]